MTARRVEDLVQVENPYSTPPNDKDLALLFKEGDASAYDVIYDRYAGRVETLCRRMLGNAHDAQEATQETFLRVYQGLGRFNGRYQLGAWTTRIATNVCLDHLRARSRRPSDPVPVEQMELESEPGEHADPEMLFIRHAEGRRVRKVLASLPPLHKAAIVLRDFEGLSYAEVAIALGLSETQVKALLHRARKGFRRSWSAPGLAALLPLRFLHRFRRFEGSGKEPAGQAVAPVTQIVESAPHMAASCSTVFQQCGQIFSEKAASLITAAVVGTAATGIALNAPSADQQRPPSTAPSVAAPADMTDTQPEPVVAKKPQRPTSKQTASSEAPSAAPAPEASPSPQPSPSSTTPAPTPSSSPDSSGEDPSKPKEDKPEPKPTPPPFRPSVGFFGEEIAPLAPVSHKMGMSCPGRWLSQSFQTSTPYQGTFLPLVLNLSLEPSTARLELDVFHNGRSYPYSSWGPSPSVTWSFQGSEGHIEVSGQYGPLYGYGHEETDLPGSGHFSASLTLDCATKSVVTESVLFTVD